MRSILRNPVLSLVAVASLSIGVTITAVAFSMIDAVIFRPLPVDSPDTLVRIQARRPDRSRLEDLSLDDLKDITRETHVFESIAACDTEGAAVTQPGAAPRVVTLGIVTTNYFSFLGVNAALGRVFGDEDDDVTRGVPAALLSYSYWQREFGGDPNIIGREIRLNTKAWHVAGVLPASFTGMQPLVPPAIWVPVDALIAQGRPVGGRNNGHFATFGRLKPDSAVTDGDAELGVIGTALAGRFPDTNSGRSFHAEFDVAAKRRDMGTLATLVALVASLPLVIACGNVMGLLFGRAEERRREMAIRLSLGAGRARLVGQLLAESSTIAWLAAAASLLVALWILRVLPALIPPLPLEVNLDFRVDLRVGLATAAVALAATMLAGIAPAFTATRTDLSAVLKAAAPGVAASGRRRGGVRQALVVAQLAVMFLLVEMAALFGMSLQKAARADTGFAPGAMAFADLAPGAAGLNRAQAADAFQTLIDRVRALPTVDAAAYARHVPLNSIYGGGVAERVVVPGHVPPPGATAFDIRQNVVSPGFFPAIGTPLIRGRDFGTEDRADTALVTVINETMARRFWDGQDAIGRRLELLGAAGTNDRSRHVLIVGIVADGKYNTLRETTPPYMFFPMSQAGAGEMTLIARGRGDERALAAALRAEITALDRNIPSLEILTRSEHFHRALFLERALAGSTMGLGGVSLALAMVGMYGVMAFAVARRRREIGIEMALGASRGRVVRNVIASGARLAGAGIAIGGALGLGAAGLLTNAVYDVSPLDPRVFLVATAVTLPLALLASAIPAGRASKIDPVQSIRESVS